MANELARTQSPPVMPGEDDFRALCAALSESARGRAFLAEHARRSRDADTQALLAAISRLEARLRADASAVERLRDDLRMLLIAIRLARPQIDAAGPASQAGQLAKLLDLLERRIDALADARPAALAPPDTAAHEPAPALPAAVLPSEEAELPMPSPAAAPAPAMPLVGKAAMAAAPPPDPLAAIMALSEDERLALFT